MTDETLEEMRARRSFGLSPIGELLIDEDSQ